MNFPVVSASNLEGKRYSIPADLEGELNVVVLAFTEWQQAEVERWTPPLESLKRRYPSLRFYEFPTITNFSPPRRALLDFWMRNGIKDPAVRERTITLYLDLPDFMAALDIQDNSTIHTLLMDRGGKILWRASGAPNSATLESLERAISGLPHIQAVSTI